MVLGAVTVGRQVVGRHAMNTYYVWQFCCCLRPSHIICGHELAWSAVQLVRYSQNMWRITTTTSATVLLYTA